MRIQTALVALGSSLVAAVPSLEIEGSEFVNPKTGNKFEIVGIAYQPGGSAGFSATADPLSQPDVCKRDAALMQAIGVNTIRVYNLNPNLNHDECASIFNAAGIYMVLDVNSPLPGEALSSAAPWESYYVDYVKHTFAVVEAFGSYPNTLLFFSGNEVMNDVPTAKYVPQYIRAITRDLKNYIKKNLKRNIPVGYSAADVRPILWDSWNYLQCSDGTKDDLTRSDVFALNSYSWCGIDATFETSSFNDLVDGLAKTTLPVFFSEYGCNVPAPRWWNETRAIYSDKMTGVFSGGVVYQWTEEDNHYGLISVQDNTLTILGDYDRLKDAWATIDWKSVEGQKAKKKDLPPPPCKASLITQKGFDSNFTAPAPPPGVQELIDNGIKPKNVGKVVKISDLNVKLPVKDSKGNVVRNLKIVRIPDDLFNIFGQNIVETESSSDDDTNTDKDKDNDKNTDTNTDTGKGKDGKGKDGDSGAMLNTPMVLAAALPLLAMLFA
ncbi:hypothetical protein E4U43_002693 [Claviceps pusilla]|uniref:1,3-beta-glucanosyltransferase n=1 Tax=Claviceps pusilla TaxID=123648 RepID=A0A9P7SVY5_9HYPO|nr:hypothetical protein E4U43_002693 [Claviceps pusilla]